MAGLHNSVLAKIIDLIQLALWAECKPALSELSPYGSDYSSCTQSSRGGLKTIPKRPGSFFCWLSFFFVIVLFKGKKVQDSLGMLLIWGFGIDSQTVMGNKSHMESLFNTGSFGWMLLILIKWSWVRVLESAFQQAAQESRPWWALTLESFCIEKAFPQAVRNLT